MDQISVPAPFLLPVGANGILAIGAGWAKEMVYGILEPSGLLFGQVGFTVYRLDVYFSNGARLNQALAGPIQLHWESSRGVWCGSTLNTHAPVAQQAWVAG